MYSPVKMFAPIQGLLFVNLWISTIHLDSSIADDKASIYNQVGNGCIQGRILERSTTKYIGECTIACTKRNDCGAYQIDRYATACNLLCIDGQCDSSLQLENLCTPQAGFSYQKVLCTVPTVDYSSNNFPSNDAFADYDTTITYSCNDGYEFPDNLRTKETRCSGSGQWTATVPHCQTCPEPALIAPTDGGGNGAGLSASSIYNEGHGYYPNSILHHQTGNGKTGGWSALSNNNQQWLQFDIGSQRTINAVATQGRHSGGQWVTQYSLQYSNDGGSWTPYNNGQVLQGNSDDNTVVTHNLTPFSARYVRLNVVNWAHHVSMRWELYGDVCTS